MIAILTMCPSSLILLSKLHHGSPGESYILLLFVLEKLYPILEEQGQFTLVDLDFLSLLGTGTW